MSNRKEITAALSAALEKKINPDDDPRIFQLYGTIGLQKQYGY